MKPGEKIKGSQPPHGGSFRYDPKTDELECVEAPADPGEPTPSEPKVEEEE